MLTSHVQVSIRPQTAQEDRYIVFVSELSTVIAAVSTPRPIDVRVENRGPHAIWLMPTPAVAESSVVYLPADGTWNSQVANRLIAMTADPRL